MGLRQLSETVKEPVLWSQDFPGFSYAWSWATFAGLAQLPAISGGHTNLISDPHMVWTQHTDIFGTSTSTSTTVNGSQKVVNLGVCCVGSLRVAKSLSEDAGQGGIRPLNLGSGCHIKKKLPEPVFLLATLFCAICIVKFHIKRTWRSSIFLKNYYRYTHQTRHMQRGRAGTCRTEA